MASEELRAEIVAASETRSREFKSAMGWGRTDRCDKLERLKDIAALANTPGGGFLIIGRDSPNLSEGSLSEEQVLSYDPTAVNSFIHEYLSPRHECIVEVHEIDGARVAVIQVPEFKKTPLIFSRDPQCPNCKRLQRTTCAEAHCGDKHFRRGQIYIRTEACETTVLEEPDHVDTLLQMALEKKETFFERQLSLVIGRGLRPEEQREYEDIVRETSRTRPGIEVTPLIRDIAPTATPEHPQTPKPVTRGTSASTELDTTDSYADERENDNSYFYREVFYPLPITVGRFDFEFIPVPHQALRIALGDLRSLAKSIFSRTSSGHAAAPFTADLDLANFDFGVQAVHRFEPHFREALRLHQSGLYRLVRIVADDIDTSGIITQREPRTIGFRYSIAMVSLFHLLSARLATLLLESHEEGTVSLRIAGMRGRMLVDDTGGESSATTVTLMSAKACTKDAFEFRFDASREELQTNALDIALKDLARFFWPFNLSDIEAEIRKWQTSLFGGSN